MASRQPPFFYHILMNPSSPRLPLPTSFVKKHLRNRILKDPILRSANGGYLWKLKMKKFDDDDDHSFCFVNGWSKVVKDVGLLFGEFLLFRYVGHSVFTMHVYSVNGCEKILVPKTKVPRINKVDVRVEDEIDFDVDDDDVEEDDEVEEEEDDDVEYKVRGDVEEDDEDVEDEEDDDVDEDDDDVEFGDDGDEDDGEDEDVDVDVDGNDGDLFFIMTSSKRNKDKLRFPPELVALTKINDKETITLKNDDGYEKVMPVRSDKQNKSKRYYVTEGWKEFQRSNDISEGDECVFKFITSEGKLCLAKVTKKKTRAAEVDNDDMGDDDDMDEEGKAEAAKDDDFIVVGDDSFDDGMDEEGEGEGEDVKLVDNDDEDDSVDGDDSFDDDGMDKEGEGEDVKLVDNDDEDDSVDGDKRDPSFIMTSSNTYQYKLVFPADFVVLAGINTKETITLKNLDGYEKKFPVRLNKQNSRTCYYLGAGWKEFQRNTNISEGDKFVVKFITSEDKFCVAKITKKKTLARPLPPAAEAPVTEVDDGIDDKDVDDNYVKDVDEDVELFDDGNPSFVATITPTYNRVLRMPTGFGELAGFTTKKTLTLKGLDGYEKKLPLRVDQKRYYVGMGWKDILQSTSISEGDKCVFKFITSEDKLCLAKIIKKETQARPQLPAAEAQETEFNDDDTEDDEDGEDDNDKDENEDVERVDDGIDDDDDDNDKDENEDVERVDDGIDDDDDNDKDENEDVEPVDDVDPFFVVNITTTHKYMLRLPPEFVELAGIDGKKNIIIKCLDGNEMQMVLRLVKQGHLTRYCLSMGWPAFKRSNNILEGDVYVFKYIRSEDKMCLEKITKKETAAETDDDLKVDGIDDKDAEVTDNKVDDENVELVDDSMDDKDVNGDDNKDEDENVELVDDGMDVDVEDNKDEDKDAEFVDGNPFFVVTIAPSHKWQLRLPTYFVVLAGLESKENIIMKSLDGNEIQMSIRTDKRHRSPQYRLSVGWPAFKRSNNISEGDECVFKYITSEDKMCLAKVIKTSATEVDVDPYFVVTITPCHKSVLRLPTDFVALAGIESKENIIMKSLDENETQMSIRTDKRFRLRQYHLSVGWPAFKQSNNILKGDECVFKYITSEDKMCLAKITKKETRARRPPPATETQPTATEVDDNDLNVDDGMDGKDVVVDDNKDEDENVELADNGIDVDAVDNKDEDKDVELVDDGMEVKDVVVDDNKDEDENVELVDDGMDGKDVVVDDNKDEDENVELVDNGMDVDANDNKDKDENVELVDGMDDNDVDEYVKVLDGMDDKDMEFDNKNEGDENENVELVDDGLDDKDVDEYVKLVDGTNNKDGDDNVELDDRDPFFRVTITPNHNSILRLPPDFVGLAGINTKKNIIVKSLDGNESQMAVRSDKRFKSLQYHLAQGWVAFTQRNNISPGDECVFKYITSEDKMCLAKVIKTSATEVDADPYFVVTITPCHKSMLWLPTDFVGLAGIATKENIIIKSLDGNETQMALRLCPGNKNQLIRYRLTMGWPAFKRSNNISEGDECVFKYITSEDKMCLAKVTKEKTQTRLPSPAEVVKRKRGWLPPVTAIKMTAAETVKMRSRLPPPVEITAAEAVKRKRGQPPPSSPRVTKDVKRKKGPRPLVHSADVEGVEEGVEVTKKPRGRPSK